MNKTSRGTGIPANERYLALVNASRSLLLSTCSEHALAEISYAPFVREGLRFYILTSDLAKHTANLLRNRQASVMFIQPEEEAANLFARERVTFKCSVAEIVPDDPHYQRLSQNMEHELGSTVSLLRSLQDFHLLQLMATEGMYIAGFGKAYTIDMDTGALSAKAKRK